MVKEYTKKALVTLAITILAVIVLTSLFPGAVEKINLFGVQIDPNDIDSSGGSTNTIEPQRNEPQIEKPTRFRINNLSMDKGIYRPGENVTLDFRVEHPFNTSYNISVNYYYDNQRIASTTQSAPWNHENNEGFSDEWVFWRWGLDKKGEWMVQVVVDYEGKEVVRSVSEKTTFKII